MKRVFFLGMFLPLAGVVMAQSGKKSLNDAYGAYSNGYYDKAKTHIDKCIEFDDTKADAKTWLYRGNIYLMIESMKMTKDSNRYKNLCDYCGETAFDAYMEANRIDPKVEVTTMSIRTPRKGLEFCADVLVNHVFDAIARRDNERAYQLAKKAYTANSKNERAIYFLGLTAGFLEKNDEAKARYSELVKMKSKNMYAYMSLSEIYKKEDDKKNAELVLEEGAPMFLRDTFIMDYATTYVSIMSWVGKNEKVIEVVEKGLQKDPKNYYLLISYGLAVLDEKKYEEAEGYFKRALEISPADVVANYNMGYCYFQNALDKFEERDKLPLNDEESYERLKAEEKALYEKARPYVEKAYELDNNDIPTLTMLQKIYARSGASDEETLKKATEVGEKLNALRKKE